MLRYFSRCRTYQAIAEVTGVPAGTVRSRLNRAQARTRHSPAAYGRGGRAEPGQPRSDAARSGSTSTPGGTRPRVPRTYRDTYAADVAVSDTIGRWSGTGAWSAYEREAIVLCVRAKIVGIWASSDLTILEIDFLNPAWATGHCPPRSTFVHHLAGGRSKRLDIHDG